MDTDNNQTQFDDFEQAHASKSSEIGLLIQTFIETVKEPKADIEKNVKALLSEAMSKMDLVTKEELDRQTALLASANKQLASLQEKFVALETLVKNTDNV